MHDGNVRIPERGKGTEEIVEAIICRISEAPRAPSRLSKRAN